MRSCRFLSNHWAWNMRKLQQRHVDVQKVFFALHFAEKQNIQMCVGFPVRGWYGKGGENLDGVDAQTATIGDRAEHKVSVVDSKEGLDTNGVSWSQPGSDTFIAHVFGLHSRLPPEDVCPGLAATLEEYSLAMFELSRKLLRLFALIADKHEDFSNRI